MLYWSKGQMKGAINFSYVEGTISWSDVADPHQDNVDQGPDPKTPEAEELANALLPVTEIESKVW